MGVGPGLYMYDVVVKRSRSLSHLLMSSCSINAVQFAIRIDSPTGRVSKQRLSKIYLYSIKR